MQRLSRQVQQKKKFCSIDFELETLIISFCFSVRLFHRSINSHSIFYFSSAFDVLLHFIPSSFYQLPFDILLQLNRELLGLVSKFWRLEINKFSESVSITLKQSSVHYCVCDEGGEKMILSNTNAIKDFVQI